MNATGFAFQLSLMLTHVASQFCLFMLLVLAALVLVVLGMGMPATAVYIELVTVVAPAVVELGADPLGANLYLFYFCRCRSKSEPVLSFRSAPTAQQGLLAALSRPLRAVLFLSQAVRESPATCRSRATGACAIG
jgi:TRAP-type uncharacterized transport system fused permease subunit